MTAHQEGRARAAGRSACPHRPRNVSGLSIVPDLILALIAIGLALAIITSPSSGLLDGRHLLAGVAVLTLTARTTRVARR